MKAVKERLALAIMHYEFSSQIRDAKRAHGVNCIKGAPVAYTSRGTLVTRGRTCVTAVGDLLLR